VHRSLAHFTVFFSASKQADVLFCFERDDRRRKIRTFSSIKHGVWNLIERTLSLPPSLSRRPTNGDAYPRAAVSRRSSTWRQMALVSRTSVDIYGTWWEDVLLGRRRVEGGGERTRGCFLRRWGSRWTDRRRRHDVNQTVCLYICVGGRAFNRLAVSRFVPSSEHIYHCFDAYTFHGLLLLGVY